MKTAPTNAALLALSAGVACVALLVAPGCNGSLAPGTPRGADGGSSSQNPDASVSPADATASTGIDSASSSSADATASTVIDSPSAGIDSASPGDGTASPGNDSAPPGIDSASPDDVVAPDIGSALLSDAGTRSATDSGADVGAIAPTIQGCPATQPVDVSTANGSFIPACETGYAHPNICCRGSPTQATECANCPGAPFAACDNASLTFPDPGTCCSLADGGCGEASVLSAPMDAGLELNCSYPCGPGGYSPHELQSLRQPVCSDLADGSLGICLYCCFGSGECPTNTCLGGPTTPPTRCGKRQLWNMPRRLERARGRSVRPLLSNGYRRGGAVLFAIGQHLFPLTRRKEPWHSRRRRRCAQVRGLSTAARVAQTVASARGLAGTDLPTGVLREEGVFGRATEAGIDLRRCPHDKVLSANDVAHPFMGVQPLRNPRGWADLRRLPKELSAPGEPDSWMGSSSACRVWSRLV